MTNVRETVRLHHQTVSNYQNYLRSARTPGTRSKVRSIQVDQRVWLTAVKLSKGDPTRIVVVSPTEVLVVNQSKRKR